MNTLSPPEKSANARLSVLHAIAAVLLLALLPSAWAAAPVPHFLKSEGYRDGADFKTERTVAPGVTHVFESFSTGPLTLNTVTVDFGCKDLMLETEKARDDMTAGETLDNMVQRLQDPDARPIFAINADFWGTNHIPIGLFVDEGTIWKDPYADRSVFAFDNEGNFSIGPARWSVELRGDTASQLLNIDHVNFPTTPQDTVIYTWPQGSISPALQPGQSLVELTLEKPEWLPNAPAKATVISVSAAGTVTLDPDTVALVVASGPPEWIRPGAYVTLEARLDNLPGKVFGVVGGGPRLLEDGRIVAKQAARQESIRDSFVTDRHPRTAVGFKADGRTVVFCVVDGRQPGRSIGIDLIDLAAWMKAQGCVDAMNLDGGGSTSMAVRGDIVNFPSDAGGPRAISNAIVVRRTAPIGPLDHLAVHPRNALVPPNASVQLDASGFDAANEPVSLEEWTLDWKADGADATIKSNGVLQTGEATGNVVVRVEALSAKETREGRPTGEARFDVLQPAQVSAIPPAILFERDEEADLRFQATADDGRPFLSDPSLWEVSVPPFLRYIPADQRVKAVDAGAGFITARLAGKLVKIPVAADRYQETLAFSFDSLPAEDASKWIEGVRYDEKATQLALETQEKKQGDAAFRFTYAMSHGGVTKIALPINAELPGKPLAVGLWVYGDGKEQWLRGELRDGNNNGYYLDFTGATTGINWTGWRFVHASLTEPPAMGGHLAPPTPPFTVKTIYIAQGQEAAKKDGEILVDALYALDLPEDLQE